MSEKRHHPQPRDLLPGEEALAGLYGARQNEHPPAHLDDAILAAARRAVSAGPRGQRHRRREWLLPTSLAASILLVTGVLLYLEYQPAETPGEFDVASVAMPAEAGVVALRDHNAPLRLVEETPAPLADIEEGALALPTKSTEIAVARERRAAMPESVAAVAVEASPAPARAVPPAYMASPREWLAEIDRLVRDGRLREARRELDALVARYPDFTSPDLIAAKKRLANVTPAQ